MKILMFEWRIKTIVWIETADDPYVIQYPIMAKKAADILVTSHLLISGWKKLVPFAMIRSKTCIFLHQKNKAKFINLSYRVQPAPKSKNY